MGFGDLRSSREVTDVPHDLRAEQTFAANRQQLKKWTYGMFRSEKEVWHKGGNVCVLPPKNASFPAFGVPKAGPLHNYSD
jgi:hypothetical protein